MKNSLARSAMFQDTSTPGEQNDTCQEHHRSGDPVDAEMQSDRAISKRPGSGHREPVPSALELYAARLMIVGPEDEEEESSMVTSAMAREKQRTTKTLDPGIRTSRPAPTIGRGDEQ